MTTSPTTTPAETPEVPSVAEQAAELASAVELLQASERFLAKAIRRLSSAVHNGIRETVEGLPLELLLHATLGAASPGRQRETRC